MENLDTKLVSAEHSEVDRTLLKEKIERLAWLVVASVAGAKIDIKELETVAAFIESCKPTEQATAFADSEVLVQLQPLRDIPIVEIFLRYFASIRASGYEITQPAATRTRQVGKVTLSLLLGGAVAISHPSFAAAETGQNNDTTTVNSDAAIIIIDGRSPGATPTTGVDTSLAQRPEVTQIATPGERDDEVIIPGPDSTPEQSPSVATPDANATSWLVVVDEAADDEVQPKATSTDISDIEALLKAPKALKSEATKNQLANIRYNKTSAKPFENGRLYHQSGKVSYAFENSPEGIEYAIKHGYGRIDLDLQVTKDGVVVATHTQTPLIKNRIKGGFRDTTGSIVNRNTKISDMTYAQVRQLKHAKGYAIYSLEELIKVADRKITLFLELKTPESLIHKLPEITEMLNKAEQKATIGGIIKNRKGKEIKGQEAALKRAQELGFWVRKLYLGRQDNTWHRPLPAKSESAQIDTN